MRSYWYPDAVSTRTVFWTYAALACVSGFVLASWGGLWFGVDMGGERWAKVALIRVFGTILVGAGLLAIAFAKVEDPSSRRRGLAYFAAAHGVVCLMLFAQIKGPWGAGLGSAGRRGGSFHDSSPPLVLVQRGQGARLAASAALGRACSAAQASPRQSSYAPNTSSRSAERPARRSALAWRAICTIPSSSRSSSSRRPPLRWRPASMRTSPELAKRWAWCAARRGTP